MNKKSKLVFDKQSKLNSNKNNYSISNTLLSTKIRQTQQPKNFTMITCGTCGQVHPSNGTHLYDYHGRVDDDLICHLCFLPFVNPIDTKCGCTFCYVCLENYLARYKFCPNDNQKIDIKQTHKASPALRKILEKLLVICPNVDFCEEILPRSQLELHLLTKCKGAITFCARAYLGCEFQGPRSVLSSHSQECIFKDKSQKLLKDPIEPGRVCQIEIHRGYEELGLFVVGGCDTPLIATVVQEIKNDSTASKDGRLQPGDHVLRLNGYDLSTLTHKEVLNLFAQTVPICTMTVYRDTLEELPDYNFDYREEIVRINLLKDKENQQLGFKIGNNKKIKGVWIVEIVI